MHYVICGMGLLVYITLSQEFMKDTPYPIYKGKLWGVFSEFKILPMFQISCYAVYNIILML